MILTYRRLFCLQLLLLLLFLLVACESEPTTDAPIDGGDGWAFLDGSDENEPPPTRDILGSFDDPTAIAEQALAEPTFTLSAAASTVRAVGNTEGGADDSDKDTTEVDESDECKIDCETGTPSSVAVAVAAPTRTPNNNTAAQAPTSPPPPTATPNWPTNTPTPVWTGPTATSKVDGDTSGGGSGGGGSSDGSNNDDGGQGGSNPRPTSTPRVAPTATATPTPLPTVVPIPANAPFFPESPVRPFDQADIRANLEKSVLTFNDFILGWGPILLGERERNRGDCGSFLGWYTHWVTEVPVYTDVPSEWGRLYFDYRVIMERASYFTNNVRRRCPWVYIDVDFDSREFPDNEEIVNWFNANKANLERLRTEANALP